MAFDRRPRCDESVPINEATNRHRPDAGHQRRDPARRSRGGARSSMIRRDRTGPMPGSISSSARPAVARSILQARSPLPGPARQPGHGCIRKTSDPDSTIHGGTRPAAQSALPPDLGGSLSGPSGCRNRLRTPSSFCRTGLDRPSSDSNPDRAASCLHDQGPEERLDVRPGQGQREDLRRPGCLTGR